MSLVRGKKLGLFEVLALVLLGVIPAIASAWSSPTFYFKGLVGNGGVSTQSQYSNTSNLYVSINSTYYGKGANRINVTLYQWTWHGWSYYGQQSVNASGGGTVRWTNLPTAWYYANVNLASSPLYGSYASGSGYMWGN